VVARGAEQAERLVERLRAGDEAAWREVIHRYGPLLRWVARQHRLNEADSADAVQTTWLRCVEHLHRLRDPSGLPAWLMTTCRRESLRTVRSLARQLPQDVTRETSSIAAVADPDGDPFDLLARRDSARLLYATMSDLPAHQRRLLQALLSHPDDGYRQLSRRLGLPVGSIGPTRRRALDRLRRDGRLAGQG
jgi:RNA polymerase sigma factor (sigma-70 family)